MNDPSRTLNAFVPGTDVRLRGEPAGPLAGLTFAVKDLFDIAGEPTGGGNPDWKRTHPPADSTAAAVLQLVDAGATATGKTITDDLACGMFCENIHYGTPVNPRAPQRYPGGSSGGSAVAVAGGLCDFALGTDTGGSVRVPAAFCGIFGMRPSHGRVSLVGCVPMAPAFDTCGWFARDAAMLARVGRVLLPVEPTTPFGGLVLARDAFDFVTPTIREALAPALGRLDTVAEVQAFAGGPARYIDAFWTIMSRQLWNANGRWYRRENPQLAPGLAERFDEAEKISGAAFTAAHAERDAITAHLNATLAGGRVMLMPTTHDLPPLRGQPVESLFEYRRRTATLTSVAGLGRLPQISLPVATVKGVPVGLSIVGATGSDRALLEVAEQLAPRLGL
jgi:amidase